MEWISPPSCFLEVISPSSNHLNCDSWPFLTSPRLLIQRNPLTSQNGPRGRRLRPYLPPRSLRLSFVSLVGVVIMSPIPLSGWNYFPHLISSAYHPPICRQATQNSFPSMCGGISVVFNWDVIPEWKVYKVRRAPPHSAVELSMVLAWQPQYKFVAAAAAARPEFFARTPTRLTARWVALISDDGGVAGREVPMR